jgi:hypothetical protein
MQKDGRHDVAITETSPVGHYRALEWVEDAKEWKMNNDMGIQVTVEVRSFCNPRHTADHCHVRTGSQDGKCGF